MQVLVLHSYINKSSYVPQAVDINSSCVDSEGLFSREVEIADSVLVSESRESCQKVGEWKKSLFSNEK